jgi:hypothetical protein
VLFTHLRTLTFSHSPHTHTHTHPNTPAHSHTFSPHSLSHSPTLTHTHSHTRTHTLSLPLQRVYDTTSTYDEVHRDEHDSGLLPVDLSTASTLEYCIPAELVSQTHYEQPSYAGAPRVTYEANYASAARPHGVGFWDEDDGPAAKLLHGTMTHEEARVRLARGGTSHGSYLVYTSPSKETVRHIVYRDGREEMRMLTVREDNAGRFSCGSVQGAKDMNDLVRRLRLANLPLLYPLSPAPDTDV